MRNGVIIVVDVENGFFVVKLENTSDFIYCIEGGPWMINDHYLTIRSWCDVFDRWCDSIEKLMVLIRFLELPLQYHYPTVLKLMGNKVGRTIKIDETTTSMSRGKFARLCVEVDLTVPLLPQYIIKGKVYKIEYEGLHTLCYHCGVFGHIVGSCPMKMEEEHKEKEAGAMENDKGEKSEEDLVGPWTVVQKVRRRNNAGVFKENEGEKIQGWRFVVLKDMEEVQKGHNEATVTAGIVQKVPPQVVVVRHVKKNVLKESSKHNNLTNTVGKGRSREMRAAPMDKGKASMGYIAPIKDDSGKKNNFKDPEWYRERWQNLKPGINGGGYGNKGVNEVKGGARASVGQSISPLGADQKLVSLKDKPPDDTGGGSRNGVPSRGYVEDCARGVNDSVVMQLD